MIRPWFFFLLFCCQLGLAQRQDFKDLDFGKADSIALKFKGTSLKNLPLLTYNLTTGLSTDVEKFRALYTWVSTNIKNDYYGYLKTTKKRKKLGNDSVALVAWNDSHTPKVFKKLITENTTACTGYAFLIKEMANLAGIACVIINGYGRTPNLYLTTNSAPNHSWNAGDATWSAGITNFEEGIPIFKQDYYDGYFLAHPKVFIKNHFPLDTKWALFAKPPSLESFLAGPVVYKDAAALDVLPVSPKGMQLKTIKNRPIDFVLQVLENNVPLEFDLMLSQGSSNTLATPIQTQGENTYTLSYSFQKTGLYDVHLRVNNVIIATYVVRVKRK